MKRFHLTCICLFGGLLLTAAATRANADAWNKKTYVTTSQSIEVPGAVLPPGKYVFKLLDSASNRHVVQIMNAAENHVYTTNLAIPKQRMDPAGKTILTFYEMPGGGPEPIRAWFYPGDTIGQEFAYPSMRAEEIARAVKQDVPILAEAAPPMAAPASLAPAPAPVAEPTPAPDNTDRSVASTEAEETVTPPPPSPQAAAPQPAEPPAPAPAEQSAAPTTDNSQAEPKMPHTAGNTAALGLIGLSCLGVAALLGVAARRAGSRG